MSNAFSEYGSLREQDEVVESLTDEEKKAIKRVVRAFKNFPDTLMIYSQSGMLEIRKPDEGGEYGKYTCVETITGVHNDGGEG